MHCFASRGALVYRLSIARRGPDDTPPFLGLGQVGEVKQLLQERDGVPADLQFLRYGGHVVSFCVCSRMAVCRGLGRRGASPPSIGDLMRRLCAAGRAMQAIFLRRQGRRDTQLALTFAWWRCSKSQGICQSEEFRFSATTWFQTCESFCCAVCRRQRQWPKKWKNRPRNIRNGIRWRT